MTESDPVALRHMRRAIALACESVAAGGGPFGAVVARGEEVVAEGNNRVTVDFDPTAHAEVTAIRRACEAVGDFALHGATLYTSCEPCPMCLASAYWARVSRIVYANTRKDAAEIGFDDSLIYDEIPKDPTERLIPMDHLPSLEARAVFDAWADKPDKVAY